MIRYQVQGALAEDPTGDYVAWTDVQTMNDELQAFVATLLDMVIEGQLSKTKAMNALATCIRLSI